MVNVVIKSQIINVMQSGKVAPKWILSFENTKPIYMNNIDSWVSGGDTQADTNMVFPSKESAIKFAEKQGYNFKIIETQNIEPAKAKSYSEIFKKDPTL